MKNIKYIFATLILITSVFVQVQATENFSAWVFKNGHEGLKSSALTFTEKSMTLELWLNMDAGSDVEKAIVTGTMDTNNAGFLLSLRKNANNNNALEIRFFAQNPAKNNIAFYIPRSAFVGQWGHLAFVISQAQNKAYAYVNGELYATVNAVGGWLGNSNIPLSIGTWYSNPKLYGKIADFRVWKTARTATEIKENFNKNLTGENEGLVVNYKFGSFSREIANDAGAGYTALCGPATNWNLNNGIETLAHRPVDIYVGRDELTWGGKNTLSADSEIDGNYIMTVEPETEKMQRNPLTGWVLYGTPGVATNFWTKLDNIVVPALDNNTVKIENYANTLYMRVSWTLMNPSEDVYAWQTNEKFKWMVENARARGMRLAFRVVVDSRDKSEDFTPAFVREAGAQGFTSGSNNQRWSPYSDDPVFQAKYEKFVRAFAQEYNDPDVVNFIDGYGLGKWGEAHDVRYRDAANRESVFKWVVDLYTQYFTKIPLAINYHRLVGYPLSWGAVNAQSEALLDYAYNKGYILRHDAFGMTSYYQSWEKRIADKWKYIRPNIMEGGWVTLQHNITNDPRGYETVADVRQGEFDDSKEARVNMMDFRVNEEWFQTSYNLVKEFIAEGGYRLYPDRLSLPETVNNGQQITITHRWNNLGWGYCPNNIPAWNYKYKVAFALLNENDEAVATFVDEQADPSQWLKDAPVAYEFTPRLSGIPAGTYSWGVAIIDKTKNNTKGIDISVKKNITSTGWMKLFDVVVR